MKHEYLTKEAYQTMVRLLKESIALVNAEQRELKAQFYGYDAAGRCSSAGRKAQSLLALNKNYLRCLYLALGYLRGKPYSALEPVAKYSTYSSIAYRVGRCLLVREPRVTVVHPIEVKIGGELRFSGSYTTSSELQDWSTKIHYWILESRADKKPTEA